MADLYSREDVKSRIVVQIRDDKAKKSIGFSVHNQNFEKFVDKLKDLIRKEIK
jgi:hypothetical protein